jgi:hypothetical protein
VFPVATTRISQNAFSFEVGMFFTNIDSSGFAFSYVAVFVP